VEPARWAHADGPAHLRDTVAGGYAPRPTDGPSQGKAVPREHMWLEEVRLTRRLTVLEGGGLWAWEIICAAKRVLAPQRPQCYLVRDLTSTRAGS